MKLPVLNLNYLTPSKYLFDIQQIRSFLNASQLHTPRLWIYFASLTEQNYLSPSTHIL